MNATPRDGNRVELLENGEAFFPRVMQLIGEARVSIYVETFILADDDVGKALQQALIAAAKRGVSVDVLADGFGSDRLSPEFLSGLADAGVRMHLYEPRARFVGLRTNVFRRMHRKITIIDARIAFLGGINYCSEQLIESGPEAMLDYAVEVEGPVVADIVAFVESSATSPEVGLFRRWRRKAKSAPADLPPRGEGARVTFLTRDNYHHRSDIEREYLRAISGAKHEVLIANAYFFPGYRLLRELRRAVRRGVEVKVIVQGRADMRIVTVVLQWLYHYIVPQGIHVLEYCARPMHAKVATIDDRWSTVGSSNLDPLSLALNLEANLFIEDAEFHDALRGRLQGLIQKGCREVTPAGIARTPWRMVLAWLLYHFLRHFPKWAGWIPAHRPRIETATPQDAPAAKDEAADQVPAVPAKRNWHRAFWIAFAMVVVGLLYRGAQAVDWEEVGAAISARPWSSLSLALALALASHAWYGVLDVLGRSYAGHRLSRRRSWSIATTCYALSLNLGALVGGLGLRVRLYGKEGVSAAKATRVAIASMVGNWMGCLTLLTLTPLWMRTSATPEGMAWFRPYWVSAISAACLLGYLWLCWRRSRWTWRGRAFDFPDLATASAQCGVAAVNWALMGGVLMVCLGDQARYADVLMALLGAAVAGAIAHVPAGWGVLEFVAVSMITDRSSSAVIAAVLVYRALYYLVPLAIATVHWVWRERGKLLRVAGAESANY